MASEDLLVVAGEASGDLHGGRLLSHLLEAMPELRPFGLGGDELQAAGLEALAHSSEIAVVGISEAIAILPRAHRVYRKILSEAERRKPSTAILIDSPDFNLRIAAALRRQGVRVLYYIGPQVWAWRSGRVKQIARDVERLLVLFPFEVEFFGRYGVEAVHVGHPLVDEVPELPHVWESDPAPTDGVAVALLPGSRESEIRRLLPLQLAAAARIARERKVSFKLIRAPTVKRELLERHLAAADFADVEVIERDRFTALAGCHAAICASGTATLELGLLGTPMVMAYRVSFWSYVIGRLLVRLPWVSLVNLVLERPAVPEFIQGDATPETLCRAVGELLDDPDRVRRMRSALSELRGRLGPAGASAAAAREVESLLRR